MGMNVQYKGYEIHYNRSMMQWGVHFEDRIEYVGSQLIEAENWVDKLEQKLNQKKDFTTVWKLSHIQPPVQGEVRVVKPTGYATFTDLATGTRTQEYVGDLVADTPEVRAKIAEVQELMDQAQIIRQQALGIMRELPRLTKDDF